MNEKKIAKFLADCAKQVKFAEKMYERSKTKTGRYSRPPILLVFRFLLVSEKLIDDMEDEVMDKADNIALLNEMMHDVKGSWLRIGNGVDYGQK